MIPMTSEGQVLGNQGCDLVFPALSQLLITHGGTSSWREEVYHCQQLATSPAIHTYRICYLNPGSLAQQNLQSLLFFIRQSGWLPYVFARVMDRQTAFYNTHIHYH